ncbi:hypothetical protein EOA60_04485 [Mesorhizobium sp. M1A.F.Ca.IN.020.06.1.1]|uniref:hypothetical protein n=1 Tax=unclassified Mesorhizobium TaxID=325217 RepID=UPI000FCC35D9|nr:MULTISPECIES: hypothetical protein [unclassified Mesorhizobium]RUV84347.1 hypothetical protein EOA51_22255 [Mesorhizobium sp. M1A.F.Ca.IN.020.32.1.1]RUW06655.1 hypothetical protein EOA46_25555 [Mesorhizobium sp. M1A.F.Ca.IN.022.05.2.1]RUW35421.1 hypothetical protein EOA60_04485 [Mesorhizobium sp. M1A.F.Ca.IN.020.06.1.1]RWF81347.1 MAG: hypothetical protein EOQ35_14400 [Mesorhizobium sp.]RWG06159.1 MAG: hypothetical protein EOQ38_01960 [Mesorhizobium sp.]
MTGLLSTASRALEEMVDSTADWAVELLRRTAAEMSHALDRDAMRDVEGAAEWRNLSSSRNRNA